MNVLRKLFNDARPKFEEGGKLHPFFSLYEGFESFLFVSNDTSKNGVNIHDSWQAACFPQSLRRFRELPLRV